MFYKMIPLFNDPQNDLAFELIIPSIPGSGFSESPKQPGLDLGQMARMMIVLMERLGHKRFFVHGFTAKFLSILYPDR